MPTQQKATSDRNKSRQPAADRGRSLLRFAASSASVHPDVYPIAKIRPGGSSRNWHKLLFLLATPAGFEPATPSLEGWCSIRLSYGVRSRIMPTNP